MTRLATLALFGLLLAVVISVAALKERSAGVILAASLAALLIADRYDLDVPAPTGDDQ